MPDTISVWDEKVKYWVKEALQRALGLEAKWAQEPWTKPQVWWAQWEDAVITDDLRHIDDVLRRQQKCTIIMAWEAGQSGRLKASKKEFVVEAVNPFAGIVTIRYKSERGSFEIATNDLDAAAEKSPETPNA